MSLLVDFGSVPTEEEIATLLSDGALGSRRVTTLGEGIVVTQRQDELLMLRMTNGKGSILYFGVLRDGLGFRSVSGFNWARMNFDDEASLVLSVHRAEVNGYSLDYGPVSFPVDGFVAKSICAGRFASIGAILLDAFHAAGAPNI